MKWILQLKHWQLFLFIVVPMAFTVIRTQWMQTNALIEFVKLFGVTAWGLWVYSIGIYGYKKLPEDMASSLNFPLFKMIFVAAFVAYPLLIFTIIRLFPSAYIIWLIGIIMYLPLLCCTFYISCFAGKVLALLKHKRQVSTREFLENLAYIIFAFIGIWILQPRINEMVEN